MTLYDDALALLKQLISNACVNEFVPDSGDEHRNAATLREFFAGVDVNTTSIESHPGRETLVVTVPGTDPEAEPLTLMGHTDVVPADREYWSTDPFDPVEKDGKLYGRGSVDMLFITATQAAVTREIARRGRPRGTLTFVGMADEESRGWLGGRWIAEHQPEAFSWRNCLSEMGGSHLPVTEGDAVVVYAGEKGSAQRRLTVLGDAGHGSTPYKKVSAIALIGEVAQKVAAIQPPVSHSELWTGVVKAFHFDPETERRVLAGEDYEPLGELAPLAAAISQATIAPTVLRAGSTINVLPGSASLDLDIRTLPGQTADDIDAILRDGLGELAEKVTIERLVTDEASESPTDTPLYRTIEDTMHHFFPDAAVVPMLAPGGSDLRFARHRGGNGYGFSLFAKERTLAQVHGQLHSHDEALDLEDLRLTVAAYEHLVTRFVGAAGAE